MCISIEMYPVTKTYLKEEVQSGGKKISSSFMKCNLIFNLKGKEKSYNVVTTN